MIGDLCAFLVGIVSVQELTLASKCSTLSSLCLFPSFTVIDKVVLTTIPYRTHHNMHIGGWYDSQAQRMGVLCGTCCIGE